MSTMNVTVSGSFHRHMNAIQNIVEAFSERDITVLSPSDPRIVGNQGEFLFVASDKHRSVRLVQDRHLASISKSDFLWLVSPDGYVGESASLELGFAIAYGIPIFAEVLRRNMTFDLTFRQYIQQVHDIGEAIKIAKALSMIPEKSSSLLIDPPTVISEAHDKLKTIGSLFQLSGNSKHIDIAPRVHSNLMELNRLLHVPGLKKNR